MGNKKLHKKNITDRNYEKITVKTRVKEKRTPDYKTKELARKNNANYIPYNPVNFFQIPPCMCMPVLPWGTLIDVYLHPKKRKVRYKSVSDMFKSENIQICLAVSMPGPSLLQTNTLGFFVSIISFYVQKIWLAESILVAGLLKTNTLNFFVSVCLSTPKKWKSDHILFKRYWRSKNTQIWGIKWVGIASKTMGKNHEEEESRRERRLQKRRYIAMGKCLSSWF